MAHHNTVSSQMLKLVPGRGFETPARTHRQGRKLRRMTCWSQFVSPGLAQLAGRSSLRDVISNLEAQASKLYHPGCGEVNRPSLGQGQRATIPEPVRGPIWQVAEPLPGTRPPASLSLQKQTPFARCLDHRLVPVGVSLGEVRHHEGHRQAACRAGSRRVPAVLFKSPKVVCMRSTWPADWICPAEVSSSLIADIPTVPGVTN